MGETARGRNAGPSERPEGSITSAVLSAESETLGRIAEEPFLTGLAQNTLPGASLDAWLREDWHFVTSLRRALGSLMASAPDERTLDVVTGAFPAIRAELDRFEAEIARRAIDVTAQPAPITASFNEAMRTALAAGPASAIAAYWAAEHAYWWAWSRVRERVGAEGPYAGWIDNWSSPAFAAFVVALADLVDTHSDLETARVVTADVFARELALWRYLWDAAASSPG